ncbi:MAG: hypothetical protein LBC21_04295 [Oscillospiraceae bacterium]|jgi:hypothetical protein|nr:hypothetical protein [Oscillospiraceae bacterium]
MSIGGILLVGMTVMSLLASCRSNTFGKGDSLMDNDILIPTVEESSDFAPQSFDYALAEQNGLISGDGALSEGYLSLQARYKAAFYAYLDNAADISQYDGALSGGAYAFPAVPPDEQGVYQKYGSYGNKYIFLRNNFHIERLDTADLETLRGSEDLSGLVGRTYKDVISVRYEDGDGDFTAIYDHGAMSGITQAPNNALVIGIAYSWEFDYSGKLVSLDGEKAKEKIAHELKQKMESEISALLGIPVTVFVYS